MRICLVTGWHLAEALRRAGHEVLALEPAGGILAIDRLLPAGFRPDLFIQVESLEARTLLEGLETLSCPSVFWSVDGHLNFAWQRHYGRLFDCLATTQPQLAEPFRAAGCRADWLPWFAPEMPFVPHARRTREVGFVGRVTAQRPARRWLVEFLAGRHGAEHAGNLDYPAMLAFYQATRIAPNEAFGGEINFRLFETAGAGCLALTPDAGPALDELFVRGRECMAYSHILELDELLSFHRRRPEAAERLGRASWEAVQTRHLAGHRAQRLLRLPAAGQSRGQGGEARKQLALAAAALWRSGGLEAELSDILGLLSARSGSPAVAAAALRLLVESGRFEAARALLTELAALPGLCRDTELSLTASLAALRLGDPLLAGRIYAARARQHGCEVRSAAGPVDLCLAWAKALGPETEVLTLGFAFDPARHLPQTASQCLLAAQALTPDDLRPVRRLSALLAGQPGTAALRLGLLSRLALAAPADWRLGLELGLADLVAFRFESGLEELMLARERAVQAGRGEAFQRLLRARDASGSVARSLGCEGSDAADTSARNPS